MTTRDCKRDGHCWHSPDGTQYQRHAARPLGDEDVTCCWCGKTVPMPMHGKGKVGTLLDVEHGKRVEVRDG